MAELNGSEGLQMVGGMVPPEVKQAIEKMASEEDRTVSKIVRRLIEESPRMKAALKQQARPSSARV